MYIYIYVYIYIVKIQPREMTWVIWDSFRSTQHPSAYGLWRQNKGYEFGPTRSMALALSRGSGCEKT